MHTRAGTGETVAFHTVQALVELCEAQNATIESLRRTLGDREQADNDRQTFKQTFAHELAAPLTAIIGILDTLEHRDLPPETAEDFVQRARRQAANLREMIEDFLDLPEGPEAAVERTPQEHVLLPELCEDVSLSVTHLLPPERLVLDVPPDFGLLTVPSRLRQILVNLLVNAAKHSPKSLVVVSAAREGYDVRIDVADRGPGIEPELVEACFRPFSQGPGGRAVGGLGLGLYLVRRLTASLGGEILLLPRDGGGTIARVILPQKRVSDRALDAELYLC